MTREEAIRFLIRIKDRINFEVTDSQQKIDALNLAIRALEHPEENVVAIIPHGDLISRQAAINELEELNANGFYEANEHSKEAYYEIKEMIKNMPSAGKTKWIPVSERLPEDAYGCYVTVEIENVLTGEIVPTTLSYLVGYDGETWNDSDGVSIPYEVIAWMPLPSPWKGEQDEIDN